MTSKQGNGQPMKKTKWEYKTPLGKTYAAAYRTALRRKNKAIIQGLTKRKIRWKKGKSYEENYQTEAYDAIFAAETRQIEAKTKALDACTKA